MWFNVVNPTRQQQCENVLMRRGKVTLLCLFVLLCFGRFFWGQQWLEAFSGLGKFFVPSCFRFPVATSRKEGCWEAAVSDVFSALKYKGSQAELLRGARDTSNSIEPCAVRAASLLSPKQRHYQQPAPNRKTPPHTAHFASQLLVWPLEDHLHILQAPLQRLWEL